MNKADYLQLLPTFYYLSITIVKPNLGEANVYASTQIFLTPRPYNKFFPALPTSQYFLIWPNFDILGTVFLSVFPKYFYFRFGLTFLFLFILLP